MAPPMYVEIREPIGSSISFISYLHLKTSLAERIASACGTRNAGSVYNGNRAHYIVN